MGSNDQREKVKEWGTGIQYSRQRDLYLKAVEEKTWRVQNPEKKAYGGEEQKQSRSYRSRTGLDPAFMVKILDNHSFSAMRNH